MQGIQVNVYRSDLGDCTNHGVSHPSSTAGRVVLMFDESIKHGVYDLEKCQNDRRFICLKVVRRQVGFNEYLHVEPFGQPSNQVGPMFGGNYVATLDSRFNAVSFHPLPVHDRFE